ncbi:hypothetical protein [Neisseria elongata]|uniref:hypothetical protein n=1 Tax=Neisseria elongata TaxID=495 RepID=UPI0006678D75|nr:hypothetical protein [Neisseria elongata]
MENENYVGYLKFYGKNIENGIIQADIAGQALIGFDECIRFFNKKQNPEIILYDYKIPVITEKGSWVVWVLGSMAGMAGIFGTAYLKKAGEKMAERDFQDIGFSDIFRKSLLALKNLVDLIKHKKGNINWGNEDFHIEQKNDSFFVSIKNESGESILIPIEQLEWFKNIPKKSLEKIVQGVMVGQSLSIGVRNENENFDSTSITNEEKSLFLSSEEDEQEEVIFPELVHGETTQLEGKLVRGNEKTNSLGFEYKGVILNCHPTKGSIRQYKSSLFLKCKIYCYINRHEKSDLILDKKPTLHIERVEPLESDQLNLF